MLRLVAAAALLCFVACAGHRPARSGPLYRAPDDVTAFVADMTCAQNAGRLGDAAFSDYCQRLTFNVLHELAQHAACTTNADCGLLSGWPPVAPLCTAARKDFLVHDRTMEADKTLVSHCGFVEPLAGMDCEARCVSGTCRAYGPASSSLLHGLTCAH